jgi:hypothetical protein
MRTSHSDGGTDLSRERQGVLLFYPVLDAEEQKAGKLPTMGFAVLFSNNSVTKQFAYTEADPRPATENTEVLPRVFDCLTLRDSPDRWESRQLPRLQLG